MRRWDIFCRVVDNFGDAGVCWRLARQLVHEHDIFVRLWIDDLRPLAMLVPDTVPDLPRQQVDGIDVCHWTGGFPDAVVADVVIEAFACELPKKYVHAMRDRPVSPVWINLEYLSAESWVEGCHLGVSPQAETALRKVFFFPGFTDRTGGLLREKCLPFDRTRNRTIVSRSWPLPVEGLIPERSSSDELRISLFCYDNPRLFDWLDIWRDADRKTTLVVPPGIPQSGMERWLGTPIEVGKAIERGALSVIAVPFLPQRDYDLLLDVCDVNFVRGEDSFVRAQWACHPFIWQAYPQAESAHHAKVEAFLQRYLEGAAEELADSIRTAWRFWNGVPIGIDPAQAWNRFVSLRTEIREWAKVWADRLDRAGDLANNLVRFATARAS